MLPSLGAARRWIHPASVNGQFMRLHRAIGRVLVGFLLIAPWVRVGGDPILLADLSTRQVFLPGMVLTPRDSVVLMTLILATGARDGASFAPSPTKRRRVPAASRATTQSCFSVGRWPASASSIPSATATSETASAESPLSKVTGTASRASEAAASGRITCCRSTVRATVGVAMGTGADAAKEAADVIVLEDSLTPVAAALDVARITRRVARQNARFSVTYNVIAVGLAAAGLVTPLVAALLMPLSSFVVVSNALSIERRVARGLRSRERRPFDSRSFRADQLCLEGA